MYILHNIDSSVIIFSCKTTNINYKAFFKNRVNIVIFQYKINYYFLQSIAKKKDGITCDSFYKSKVLQAVPVICYKNDEIPCF